MNSTYTMERSASAVRDLPSLLFFHGQPGSGKDFAPHGRWGRNSDVPDTEDCPALYSPWRVQPSEPWRAV